MLLVSKSDFANFSYRSSFPCRAHSASCRGCASVNKMENFARRLRPCPPYPVYFLSPRQEPAAAFTLPVFRRSSDRDPRPETTRRQTRQTRLPVFFDTAQTQTQTTRQTRLPVSRRRSDTDPRPETTRRRGEQTRLVFQRQLGPLSVVDSKFSYKSIFGGTAIRRI